MPILDGDDRVVGGVAYETSGTGYYVRIYLVLDFSDHKLRMYPEEAELLDDVSTATHNLEINCQYITKVGGSSVRPKSLNSLEIVTTNGTHHLSVDSIEERDEWAESIRKASMRQGSAKQVASFIQQKKDISYQTKVVGGVVQRIPIVQTGDSGRTKGEAVGAESKGAGHVGGAGIGYRRSRGFPRIIKAGHGTKLGHVRKNWKKRFFVLTEIALGYYKSIEEVDPIKTVPVAEITSVQTTTESGKDLMEVVTPGRTFLVQFDTMKEMNEWVEVFRDLLSTVKPSPQHGTSHVSQHVDHTPSSDEQSSSLEHSELGTLV